MELKTGENDSQRRLDRILRKALRNCPLSLIHRLLRQGLVFVDGMSAEAGDCIKAGSIISIPSLNEEYPAPRNDPAEHTPDILWQGLGLIAVNKPCGLPVHGQASLDTIVRSYLSDKLPPSLSFVPGPLHRLDKPTSGIVVFSTSIDGARFFSSLMRERSVKKTYLALVEGYVEKEEIWQDDLVRNKKIKKTFVEKQSRMNKKTGAKSAITRVSPIAHNGRSSLVVAEISTGRTHQIRAQAAAHRHPLAGDIKYGGKSDYNGFFLHARKLEFKGISIEAPLPPAFENIISKLFGTVVIG
ncbi:MAG: RluA family pseudouridine synthase [Treponema sp.]|nr:RluA family pseudouridine synthase [Treponema sp.]